MNINSHKVSIVIPVYNEGKTLEQVLENIKRSVIKQGLNAEIIVVNDGSTDQSLEIIKKIGGIVFINLEKNQGKGAAVKEGFKAGNGDIFLIQDADNEYDPDDYTAVLTPIIEGEAETTMGSRFMKEKPVFFGKRRSPYFTHYIGNRLIIWVTNFLYGCYFTDYEGCYKAFSREVIETIPVVANGFDYDNEIICKALRRGYRIKEVPIKYHPRSYENGKKITWKHGIKMLCAIIKFRYYS